MAKVWIILLGIRERMCFKKDQAGEQGKMHVSVSKGQGKWGLTRTTQFFQESPGWKNGMRPHESSVDTQAHTESVYFHIWI